MRKGHFRTQEKASRRSVKIRYNECRLFGGMCLVFINPGNFQSRKFTPKFLLYQFNSYAKRPDFPALTLGASLLGVPLLSTSMTEKKNAGAALARGMKSSGGIASAAEDNLTAVTANTLCSE